MQADRWLRQRVNPLSTAVTKRWHGTELRGVPDALERHGGGYWGVRSPGAWQVPPGVRPGWSWLPEGGGFADLSLMPRWVKIAYRTPVVDRFAHTYMWSHGGWLLRVDAAVDNERRGGSGS